MEYGDSLNSHELNRIYRWCRCYCSRHPESPGAFLIPTPEDARREAAPCLAAPLSDITIGSFNSLHHT